MSDPTERAQLVVIGAGILGLATARAFLLDRRGAEVIVLDKEPAIAQHQSGHNSGVVHSGIYYRPGSDKARLCTQGRQELEEYCAATGVDLERLGKVVVATDASEVGRLDELARRARANGIEIELLGRRGLGAVEPHTRGVAALHVPGTGVVDYPAVCEAMARDIAGLGGRILTNWTVRSVSPDGSTGSCGVELGGPRGRIETAVVVNCAGLHSDRIARASGARTGATIVPFRGEYRALRPERAQLVRGLIYPVADPRLPFLGVHATRGHDGSVHVGPNAVLALGREGYRWADISARDLAEDLRSPQLRGLARRWWRNGIEELARSLSPRLFLASARKLVPDLCGADLTSAPSGVRAQAVGRRGELLDDFVFAEHGRVLSVLNAPSPAATASLAIGREIAARAGKMLHGS